MAGRTRVSEYRDFRGFSSVLSSAVLEWLLILLLFLDGLFSYMVTRFAHFCKLQIPCLLCSRLDHILGNEKPGFYRDLICKAHKSEISSLACCVVHQKLADVHDMCEGCLLSFATEKKSNTETCRFLVGKLGVDFDNSHNGHPKLPSTVDGDVQRNGFYGDDVTKVPLLKKDPLSDSPFTRHCSCCSEPFRNKSHAVTLNQDKPVGFDVAEGGISLSSSTGHSHLHLEDKLSKTTEKSFGSTTINQSRDDGFDRLPHIGYSELKITSDSESEVPSSDDDGENALVHGTKDLKEEFAARCLQPETVAIISNSLSTTASDNKILEKLIHPAPTVLEPPLSIHEGESHDLSPEKQLHESESHDISTLASTIAIGHGLEELNWSPVEVRANPSAPSEIISEHAHSENSDAKLNTSEIGDAACISSTSSMETFKASTEVNLDASQIMNESGPSLHVHMDLNDAYKLAIGSKSSLTSPTFTEVVTGRDSSRVHEDLKLLISQVSTTRGLESPWNNLAFRGLESPWSNLSPSPRVNYLSDEFKFSDASSSAILQNITKRLSIERNESGLESLDGSIVSEVEGESALDRLKRQIELDRKSMSLLYKELEEERSASAIAANQAMAMITRLQEEKAAMQMEALQYQRMMEEQAEYDQEALQKSNELLAQREKEIQDMDAEVGCYKKRFREDSLEHEVLESSGDAEARGNNPTSTPLDKKSRYAKSEPTIMMSQDSRLTESHLKVSVLDFEDEKVYISDCLRELEKKLRIFSNHGVYVDESRGDAEEDEFHVKTCEDHIRENCEQENGMLKDNVRRNGQYSEETAVRNDLETPHRVDVSQGISRTISEVFSEKNDEQFSIKGVHKKSQLCSNSDDNTQYAMVSIESDLRALENEVLCLNKRLEGLEADRNFLEHTINSLRNGDDGIQFVQEIACHLRELRRIGIMQR